MQEFGKKADRYSAFFCAGALCGTAAGFISALPAGMSGAYSSSFGFVLAHSLIPFAASFLLCRTVHRAALLFLRGFNVSLLVTLLLRAGNEQALLGYGVSLLFLLPGYFLWIEPCSAAFTKNDRGRKLLRRGAILLLWFTGSYLRCRILRIGV